MKKKNTLVGRACDKVSGFAPMYEKLAQQVTLNGYSASTLTNYGRCIVKKTLYFDCTILELDDEQINNYLVELNATQSPSKSYFSRSLTSQITE